MYEVLDLNSTAKNLDNYTFTDYFYRLMLMARSVFKWEGLPDGIDEKWIERYLFAEGQCMFFEDKNLGFMVAKTSVHGTLNYYDEPTILMPYATNYDFEMREYQNYMGQMHKESIFPYAVLIRNNDMMLPTAPTIRLYAYRLTEIMRTIDINIIAQQTPVLIKCGERQRLTLKNVYKQWRGHEPVIFGDNGTGFDFDVLKTDAPIVFDKLQIQKHAIWNECMTFLGINNANMDKRERLVDDEVQANNEQIELSASVMLKARERACKLINELFGLNLSVRLRNREEIEAELRKGDDEDVRKVHGSLENAS